VVLVVVAARSIPDRVSELTYIHNVGDLLTAMELWFRYRVIRKLHTVTYTTTANEEKIYIYNLKELALPTG